MTPKRLSKAAFPVIGRGGEAGQNEDWGEGMESHADTETQRQHVNRIERMEEHVGALETKMERVIERQNTVWSDLYGGAGETGIVDTVKASFVKSATIAEVSEASAKRRHNTILILLAILTLLVAIAALPQVVKLFHAVEDNAPQLFTPQGFHKVIDAATTPPESQSSRKDEPVYATSQPAQDARIPLLTETR